MGDYHGFMPTGVPAVDEILWAVDDATNAHHNATWWVDEQVRKDGPTYSEHIQKKANDAAALIASAPSLKEEVERLRAALVKADRAFIVHAFTPRGFETQEDRDTCSWCGCNIRDYRQHIRVDEGHPSDVQAEAMRVVLAALGETDS